MQPSASANTAPDHDSEASGSEKPSLQEVIERIGFGPAQLRYCLTGGGVYLADGAELLLITAVTTAVARDWGLGPIQRGMAVTIVFIGVLIGNLVCGPMGDRYGRRLLIIISYVFIFIFSVLSSFAGGYYTFSFFRLLVGFSFGIGGPAWNALCTEVTPRYWRIAMNGVAQALFSVGEIYSALLILADDPDLTSLHWRLLLQLGAIPSALFAIAAAIFLLQSPSFLAIHGQHDAAKGVLEVMKADNRVDASVSTDFQVVSPVRLSGREFGYQVRKIFNRNFCSSTIVIMLTCFGLNIVYYGCLYAFPLILPELQGGGSAGVQLLVGAFWEIPGVAAGVFCGMWMPRKPAMKSYLVLITISLGLFIMGVTMKTSWISQVMYHGGYYGIKIVSSIGFIVVYQYASEIYPTETRATGTSMCIGSGRLGAMVAPLLFEGFEHVFNTYIGFFYFVAAFCALNFMLVDFLPFETADMLIKDRLMPDESDISDSEAGNEAYGSLKDDRIGGKASGASTEMNPNLDDGCTAPPPPLVP